MCACLLASGRTENSETATSHDKLFHFTSFDFTMFSFHVLIQFDVHGVHFQDMQIEVIFFSLFLLFSFRVSVQCSWTSLSGNTDFSCFIQFIHFIQFSRESFKKSQVQKVLENSGRRGAAIVSLETRNGFAEIEACTRSESLRLRIPWQSGRVSR